MFYDWLQSLRLAFRAKPKARRRTYWRSDPADMVLEDRICLSATVMSFGADVELFGVGVQSDGDTVLVGNRVNLGTGFNEGVILEIEADDGSVSESLLGTFGGDTFVTAVSPNGQYVTGTSFYTDGTPGSGYLVDLSNPGVLTATGGLGPVPESFGFDVSNSGTVVGTTHGLGVPYSWSASTGIVGLTPPKGGGAGHFRDWSDSWFGYYRDQRVYCCRI